MAAQSTQESSKEPSSAEHYQHPRLNIKQNLKRKITLPSFYLQKTKHGKNHHVAKAVLFFNQNSSIKYTQRYT